jgi:hypothetical protein
MSRSDDEIVRMASAALPVPQRSVLETIGASQWEVVEGPLGEAGDAFLRSGGFRGFAPAQRRRLNGALGVWLPPLKVTLIRSDHPTLEGLDARSRNTRLSLVAWHEWAHALSMSRCTGEDIRVGEALLERAPDGVREHIRSADYPRSEFAFEVIAEVFALLMARRLAGQKGRPSWLDQTIYEMLMRVTGWTG